jgi:hypothetical protein
MGSPSRPRSLGRPGGSISGKRQAHLGHRRGHRTPALLGQEWPQPVGHPSSPIQPQTAPSPDSEPAFSGAYGRGGLSPAAPTGARSMDAPSGRRPASDETHAQPRPPVSGRVGPVLTYGAALFEPPQGFACGRSAVYKSWPVEASRYISLETIALRAMIHAWAGRLFKETWGIKNYY